MQRQFSVLIHSAGIAVSTFGEGEVCMRRSSASFFVRFLDLSFEVGDLLLARDILGRLGPGDADQHDESQRQSGSEEPGREVCAPYHGYTLMLAAQGHAPPPWRCEDASSCVREWLCPLRISEFPGKSNEFLGTRRTEWERVEDDPDGRNPSWTVFLISVRVCRSP